MLEGPKLYCSVSIVFCETMALWPMFISAFLKVGQASLTQGFIELIEIVSGSQSVIPQDQQPQYHLGTC